MSSQGSEGQFRQSSPKPCFLGGMRGYKRESQGKGLPRMTGPTQIGQGLDSDCSHKMCRSEQEADTKKGLRIPHSITCFQSSISQP